MSLMIEIFADLWCPFAYVGIRRVFQYRDELGRNDMPIIVRSWPLELVNDAPMARAKALGNCDALREQIASDLFANDCPSAVGRLRGRMNGKYMVRGCVVGIRRRPSSPMFAVD